MRYQVSDEGNDRWRVRDTETGVSFILLNSSEERAREVAADHEEAASRVAHAPKGRGDAMRQTLHAQYENRKRRL